MKNVKYFTAKNIPLSLSNLFYGKNSSVIAILDAVEDAETAVELCRYINALKLNETFTIDRVTEKYARLKSVDCWGNVHYLRAEF